jgi:tetratricopeptide (TPR) repeat protein
MSQKNENKDDNTKVNNNNSEAEAAAKNLNSSTKDNTNTKNQSNNNTNKQNKNQLSNTNLTEKSKDVDFEHDSEAGTESTVSSDDHVTKDEKWETLSPEETTKRFNEANKLKEEGNKFYNESKYHEAIEKFSHAIALVERINDPRSAVYYANRSACYLQLGDFKAVVRDCTSALERDSKYVKAWLRRACAQEKLNNLTEALEDYKKDHRHCCHRLLFSLFFIFSLIVTFSS